MKLLVTLCATLIVAPCLANAGDLTIKQHITSTGFMGMGGFEDDPTEMFAGDAMKHRRESNMKFTGGVMGMLAGGPKSSVTIDRLDKGLVWTLDVPAKEYKEETFEERAKQMKKGMDQMKGSDEKQSKAKITFEIKKPGKTETVCGHACDATDILMHYIADSTKPSDEVMDMTFELFLCKDCSAGIRREYELNYAKALGLDYAALKSMAGGMGAMQFGKLMGAAFAQSDKLEGAPLKTVMTMNHSGVQAEAMKKQAAEKANEPEPEAPSLGGIVGGMFGVPMPKREAKPAAKRSDKVAEDPTLMFTMTTTTTSISFDGVAATSFEIPAGFSKK